MPHDKHQPPQLRVRVANDARHGPFVFCATTVKFIVNNVGAITDAVANSFPPANIMMPGAVQEGLDHARS